MLLEIAKSFEADVVLCLGIMFKIFQPTQTERCVDPWLDTEIMTDFEHFERH